MTNPSSISGLEAMRWKRLAGTLAIYVGILLVTGLVGVWTGYDTDTIEGYCFGLLFYHRHMLPEPPEAA